MKPNWNAITTLEEALPETTRDRIRQAAGAVVAAKERGGKIAVITGSGPNVHEGVTTLLAELIRTGILDGVTTSSAVVAHELGGTLDKVKRCDGLPLGLDPALLPRGGEFELTQYSHSTLEQMQRTIKLDDKLLRALEEAPGKTIIKAAGNLGYPVGLWLEVIAPKLRELAQEHHCSFEEIAGLGADPRTMIGAAALRGVPALVTIPQLVGGGNVGLAIGDSISITNRAQRLAHMLDTADVIFESGVALTQEIHDGPLERYTGHGLWSAWQNEFTYSLEGKRLIRIDLDPALETVCQAERDSAAVQQAIANGLPKTKLFKVPFRMEMSGFARHPGSLAIIADLGVVWPILAKQVSERLGIALDFVSYPQQTPEGQTMREWIVENIAPFHWDKMCAALEAKNASPCPITV